MRSRCQPNRSDEGRRQNRAIVDRDLDALGGRIDDREYALCLEYATRIGYGRAFLDDLIQKFSQANAPDSSAASTISTSRARF